MVTRCSGILCLCLLAVSSLPSQVKSTRVFVIEDPVRKQLCGYIGNDEWSSIPKRQDVEFVATVDSVNGVVTRIRVETYTEDFTTHDNYSLNKRGHVIELNRSLDAITDRVRRDQVWKFSGGRAIKNSETWKDLNSNESIGPVRSLDFLVDYIVISRLQEFPFYSLVQEKHPENWPKGKKCIAGSMDKLNEQQPPE
jgi:hypothetical protein